MVSDIDRLTWPKDGNTFQWIDRLEKIIGGLTKIGVAYAGANALKHPMGAIVGLTALRLATSNNLAAGAVGSATLAGIGLLNYTPEPDGGVTKANPVPQVIDPSNKYPFESWLTYFYQEGKPITEESYISPDVSLLPPTHGQPPITRLPK